MKKLILFLHDISGETLTDRLKHQQAIVADEDLCDTVVVDSDSHELKATPMYSISFSSLYENLKDDIEHKTLRTIAVLPAQQCLLSQVYVASKQYRQIQKALPFLLEDQLASDPEDCFFAKGNYQNELLQCGVIEKQLLVAYKNFFQEKSLNCDTLVNISNLNVDPGPNIQVVNNLCLLKTSNNSFSAFEVDLLDFYLPKILEAENSTQTIARKNADDIEELEISSEELINEDIHKKKLPITIFSKEAESANEIEQLVRDKVSDFSKETEFNYDLQLTQKDQTEFFLERAETLSQNLLAPDIINFFQGEFKVRRVSKGFELDVNLKPVAALLSALVAISLLSVYIDTYRFNSAAEKAEVQTKQVFNQIFPGTKNYTRMQQRVKALLKGDVDTGGSEFIELMVLFSEGLAKVNEGNTNAIKPQRFQYEQNSNSLKIDVNALNFDNLNELKELSSSLGLDIEIASTSTADEGVKGRLEVRLK